MSPASVRLLYIIINQLFVAVLFLFFIILKKEQNVIRIILSNHQSSPQKD